MNISTLLHEDLDYVTNYSDSFHEEQLRDSTLHPIMVYLYYLKDYCQKIY